MTLDADKFWSDGLLSSLNAGEDNPRLNPNATTDHILFIGIILEEYIIHYNYYINLVK